MIPANQAYDSFHETQMMQESQKLSSSLLPNIHLRGKDRKMYLNMFTVTHV